MLHEMAGYYMSNVSGAMATMPPARHIYTFKQDEFSSR